ncbi:hypothetical protein SAMN04487831_104221 [Pseudobutyrivibrio sp. UC1225]|uniref:YlcI/YnfO family protein n=1 Tax=Pseudobutyrivibrio sp. UC1225 TaxID=1798185 RepID=UPI0008E699E0|nr:YlcI/YnfO family protein [Pseudobutyrivibrio sp. UC1225]SFN88660.1 hypothetical protein SAMN04487831_104221 [Pseudobutyrivibrio sp. UC1225]
MTFKLKTENKGTGNKTVRFPQDLLKEIEEAIEGKDVTFSAFVVQACQYALENLEDKDS